MCFQTGFKDVECRTDPKSPGAPITKSRLLCGLVFLVKRPERYDGANPFRDLITTNKTVKLNVLETSVNEPSTGHP